MGAGGAWAKTQDCLKSLQQTEMRGLVTCHAGCPWEAMSAMNHIMGLGPTSKELAVESGSRAHVRVRDASMYTGSLIFSPAGPSIDAFKQIGTLFVHF